MSAIDPLTLAVSGGEDYELLFSLRPGAARGQTLARLRRRLGAPAAADVRGACSTQVAARERKGPERSQK